jgi:hypothetical protein
MGDAERGSEVSRECGAFVAAVSVWGRDRPGTWIAYPSPGESLVDPIPRSATHPRVRFVRAEPSGLPIANRNEAQRKVRGRDKRTDVCPTPRERVCLAECAVQAPSFGFSVNATRGQLVATVL